MPILSLRTGLGENAGQGDGWGDGLGGTAVQQGTDTDFETLSMGGREVCAIKTDDTLAAQQRDLVVALFKLIRDKEKLARPELERVLRSFRFD